MQPTANGLVPHGELAQCIAPLLAPFEARGLKWQVQSLSPLLDSANMQPEHWNQLAESVIKHVQSNAVILIHGTDSMAYTASALSFLLHQRIDKPVILTGSQYPLGYEGGDAQSNFVEAVEHSTALSNGIFVSFAGQLILGARSVKVDANGLAAFAAPKQQTMQVNSTAIGFDFTQPRRPFEDINVWVLKITPALSLKQITTILDNKPDAIILEVYGVGTLADQNIELIKSLKNASTEGTLLLAVTQCHAGGVDLDVYAISQALHDIEVIDGKDMTTEAALTKIMVLLHLGYPKSMIRTLMPRNICGELTDA